MLLSLKKLFTGHKGVLTNRWAIYLGLIIGLTVLVITASLPLAPSVKPPGRDNGIFAYTANVVFDGGTLYQDAWDNKLPGVYYINVLAFHLFGPTPWAVWLIDVIFVWLTALIFFRLLNTTGFDDRIALVTTVLFVLLARHPIIIHDVNFTETYALLPQVLIFALGYRFLRQPNARLALFIGLCASLSFLIKQTTIGGALALIPALLLSRHPVIYDARRWRWLGAVILGGVTGLGGMALYLMSKGIFGKAIYASIISPVTFHKWVSASVTAFDPLADILSQSTFPLLLLLVSMWVIPGAMHVIHMLRGQSPSGQVQSATRMFGTWALLTVLVDLLLVNITGRGYSHYYATLVPALALLSGIGLDHVQRTGGARRRWLYRAARMALIFNAIIFFVAVLIELLWAGTGSIFGPTQVPAPADYVINHTKANDTVLVWGASSDINFLSQRDSPTKFHYGYPLIVPDETTDEQVQELIDDLLLNQPALIVDTTVEDGNRIPPLDPLTREVWKDNGGRLDVENLAPVFAFVDTYCYVEARMDEIMFYRCDYTRLSEAPPGS